MLHEQRMAEITQNNILHDRRSITLPVRDFTGIHIQSLAKGSDRVTATWYWRHQQQRPWCARILNVRTWIRVNMLSSSTTFSYIIDITLFAVTVN